MPLFDAHCHLQDSRLALFVERITGGLGECDIAKIVVNGTRESDWPRVAELSERYSEVKASYGLHPWFVDERSDFWEKELRRRLEVDPEAGLGEIGLDRWIEGFDIELQKEIFLRQLRIGVELDRPISIHCLRAWGILHELLKQEALPPRGFLLHSYGGSSEMIKPFVQMGAWFSFSAYFAIDRKRKQCEVFRQIPIDRLLIETDAPDMLGPPSLSRNSLRNEEGAALNSPLNLPSIYRYAAELWEIDPDEFESRIQTNFHAFFGAC